MRSAKAAPSKDTLSPISAQMRRHAAEVFTAGRGQPSSVEEEEGFYKLRPANKTDHLASGFSGRVKS